MKIKVAVLTAALMAAMLVTGCSSDSGKKTDESSKAAASSAVSAQESKDESKADASEKKESSDKKESSSATEESKSEGTSDSALIKALEKVKSEVEMPAETADTTARRLKRDFGITEDMYDDFAGLYCTDGLAQDMVVYVKAKDESSADQIAQKLQDNWQSKYNVIKNYSPEQMANIEAAKVERNGLYVSLVISADAEKIKSIFSEAIG